MQLDQNLSQEQKLILTQSLTMSIKVLEMNAVQLSEFIKEELSENPILECDSSDDYTAGSEEIEKIKRYFEKSVFEFKDRAYDDDLNNVTPLNFISEEKTLRNYLKEQLGEMKLDNNEIKICEYIIENIDERGYFPLTVNECAKEIGFSEEEITSALSVVQSMEPCGVGSRDLKECLAIQLKGKNMYTEKMRVILEECLTDIADAKYSEISRKADISLNKARQYCEIIKSLEPKPSRGYYTGDETKYVIPDAEIYKEDDQFNIRMTDGIIPKIKINNEYRKLMSSGCEKDAKEYIRKKNERARNLITSVEKREDTMCRILEYILDYQKEYFRYGKEKLKPMSIRQLAEELELSDSTISRAVKEKYILTPNGMIAVRSLFTSSLNQGLGEISTDTVKNKIKSLIEGEDKKKPLSDQKICSMLNDYNIEISRRTVAKYREELGIESSSRRKKF